MRSFQGLAEVARVNPGRGVDIAVAEGRDAGQQLAALFGFPWSEPGSMWDVLDRRQVGEFAIGLIGDERFEIFTVSVTWNPCGIPDRAVF